MQKSRNKTATTIAMLLVSTIALTLIALPAANAQLNVPYVSTGKQKTYAFIGATPNPVGVGQEVLLHIGITQQLASAALGWYSLSVTIERPDGKVDTISDITTDSTGGTGRVYVPTMAGNYTLQTHFPEQRMPTTVSAGTFNFLTVPANTTMLASSSPKLTLIVTEEQRQYYPGVPLPSEYWTRPINAQLREWSQIAGSSWHDDTFNEAPESPHILWTRPLTTGGLVGGELGNSGEASIYSFEHGDAYEGKYAGRLILAGKLYYQAGAYDRPRLWHCVDLRTGELLWSKTFLDNQSIAFGQLFHWTSYNYHGTFAYLWVTVGTTWTAFDAFTGEWVTTFTNMPSGTRIEGPLGEQYIYSISLTTARMTLWNMSAFVSMAGSFGSAFTLRQFDASSGHVQTVLTNGTLGAISYTAATNTTAAARVARATALNFTFPTGLAGSVRAVTLGDKVIGGTFNQTHVINWAFSLKPGQEGQLLYNKALAAPAEWYAGNQSLSWSTQLAANIGLVWSKEALTHWAYDLTTGDYLWKTEVPQNYLDIYSIGRRIEYGKMYSVGQAGILYCWDATNGKLLWTYGATDPYSEFLWGPHWSQDLLFIQGGKIYLFHSEHSPVNPLFRGAPAICLNANDGTEIWRVDGLFRKTDWGGSPIMGDSVIAMYNSYDQRVYAIGKGPSAMTVEAPMAAITLGSSVVIRGKVTDVSPGTKQTSVTLRFPNGVPAVSDESQGEWMKYVYAQFERPKDVKGVDVTISVLDSNGNYRDIGTTTADSDGFFKLKWTPDIEGEYTVYASFPGSASYYPSHATSAFTVDPAPPPPAEPEPEPPSMTDTYVLGMGIAIIIAVVIVGAVLALILRKRA